MRLVEHSRTNVLKGERMLYPVLCTLEYSKLVATSYGQDFQFPVLLILSQCISRIFIFSLVWSVKGKFGIRKSLGC